MHAQLRRLSDIDSRTKAAWAALAMRAVEPNPFFDPVFVLPLAHHLRLDLALLTVERGAEMVFCLPLLSGTFPWRGLTLGAWRAWNPLTTPLLDAAGAGPALSSAVAHLASVRGPRLLVLDYVTTDGPVAAALEVAATGSRRIWPSIIQASTRPALRRREDSSYLAATLHGKHKRKLAWARRFLERTLGAPPTVIKEPNAGAIERFLSMEAGGWKGRMGSALACNPGRAAFFREMCAGFAEQGRLQVLSLQAAGTTLAMKYDIRYGGVTFGLRTAYDEHYAQGSPGVQLEIDAVGVFHANGDEYSDSCTNHENNPQAWLYPDTRSLTRFVVSLNQPSGVDPGKSDACQPD